MTEQIELTDKDLRNLYLLLSEEQLINVLIKKHKEIRDLNKIILNFEKQVEQVICTHCGKYKTTQGNGILHQLCECRE